MKIKTDMSLGWVIVLYILILLIAILIVGAIFMVFCYTGEFIFDRFGVGGLTFSSVFLGSLLFGSSLIGANK